MDMSFWKHVNTWTVLTKLQPSGYATTHIHMHVCFKSISAKKLEYLFTLLATTSVCTCNCSDWLHFYDESNISYLATKCAMLFCSYTLLVWLHIWSWCKNNYTDSYHKQQKLSERKVSKFTWFHPNVRKTFSAIASSVWKVLMKTITQQNIHQENFKLL